jgi:hypothetical protein
MVHYSSRGCKNNITELTRWEELHNPLLELAEADVVSGRDDTSLVQATVALAGIYWHGCRSFTGHSIGQRSCRSGGHQSPRTLQYNLHEP